MAVKLDDNRELLESINPTLRDSLAANFTEAARIMSPAGLHNYLEGARALSQLGRGNDLVASYIEEMPAVVKEAGKNVIKDCVNAALKLASMVSGEIISLLFATLPAAARRLGDAELLRQYLNLIHQLTGKVPRGIRPMLAHLDELFGKLTLGGLRRWALWGAQAHGRDMQAQMDYFNLVSTDSLAVLQQERRGTLLVDNQRKLNLYLRALWARDFFLRPTSGDYESREGYKPFIDQRVIHLPDAFDDYAGIAGGELYRAAAAHAAAHLMYTRAPISAEALTPAQMIFIGLFEDARVEHLAIQSFPGLTQLWAQYHAKKQQQPKQKNAKQTPQQPDKPQTQAALGAIPRETARGELRGRSRSGNVGTRRLRDARRQLCRRRSLGTRRGLGVPRRIRAASARQSLELGPRRHVLQRTRRTSSHAEPARAGIDGDTVSRRQSLYLVLRRGRLVRRGIHTRERAPSAQAGQRHGNRQRSRLRTGRRRRAGGVDLQHRTLSLRRPRRQLQRDVGQRAGQ